MDRTEDREGGASSGMISARKISEGRQMMSNR